MYTDQIGSDRIRRRPDSDVKERDDICFTVAILGRWPFPASFDCTVLGRLFLSSGRRLSGILHRLVASFNVFDGVGAIHI